jgi:hypothetical protein
MAPTSAPSTRHRSRLDHRHLSAPLARRGDELGADPPGANHDHATGEIETLAQRVAVGERAQVVDTVQISPRDRYPARLGASRQQQPFVGELASVVECDLRVDRVQASHRRPGHQLDLVLAIERLGVDVGLLARRLTSQIVLGQRRALVRALGLVADQDHFALETLLAQRLGGFRAGETGAYDHDRLRLGAHQSLLVVRARNSWRVRESSRTRSARAGADPRSMSYGLSVAGRQDLTVRRRDRVRASLNDVFELQRVSPADAGAERLP